MIDKMFKIKWARPYYEDENFLLYLGDSIGLLKKAPGDTFDMIFTLFSQQFAISKTTYI